MALEHLLPESGGSLRNLGRFLLRGELKTGTNTASGMLADLDFPDKKLVLHTEGFLRHCELLSKSNLLIVPIRNFGFFTRHDKMVVEVARAGGRPSASVICNSRYSAQWLG